MVTRIFSIINSEYNSLFQLYKFLHQNPEVSNQEKDTSDRIASELEKLGIEVVRNFSGYGFVGILKNGDGPIIMIRTDLDALPIEEKTELDFASKKSYMNSDGNLVKTMHACGHDMHMTIFVGTARVITLLKDEWKGTIIFVGQPAEEVGTGAKQMIEAGLYRKFPLPSAVFAYHILPELEAGKIGYVKGTAFANVDMIDLHVFGKGGHGALPHKCIDPIVMASQIILALQTITSRKLNPLTPAVVSVGSIHGGTKHNIIPDEVKLEITIRSYSENTRNEIISQIALISKGIAISAGISETNLPKLVIRDNFTPAVINNSKLVTSSLKGLKKFIKKEDIVELEPEMIAEDFAYYGQTEENIPIAMFRVGSTDKNELIHFKTKGENPPSLHSPFLKCNPEITIKHGIAGMLGIIFEELKTENIF